MRGATMLCLLALCGCVAPWEHARDLAQAPETIRYFCADVEVVARDVQGRTVRIDGQLDVDRGSEGRLRIKIQIDDEHATLEAPCGIGTALRTLELIRKNGGKYIFGPAAGEPRFETAEGTASQRFSITMHDREDRAVSLVGSGYHRHPELVNWFVADAEERNIARNCLAAWALSIARTARRWGPEVLDVEHGRLDRLLQAGIDVDAAEAEALHQQASKAPRGAPRRAQMPEGIDLTAIVPPLRKLRAVNLLSYRQEIRRLRIIRGKLALQSGH